MSDQEVKSNSSSGDNCSICLASLKSKEPIELECGHTLHQSCLTHLLISAAEKGQVYKCPLCRNELSNYKDVDINELRQNTRAYTINIEPERPQNSSHDDLSINSETARPFPEQTPLLVRALNDERQERKKCSYSNAILGFFIVTITLCTIIFVNKYSNPNHQNIGNYTHN